MIRLIPLLLMLPGCAMFDADFLKDIEHRSYDSLAYTLSIYCSAFGVVNPRVSIELSREIRQRGIHGPAGPLVPVLGLDDKTAHGTGPVVQIWCREEMVPPDVWALLVRDWRD